MPRHTRTSAALAALMILGATAATAQQKIDDSFHWAAVIATGNTLLIQNVNGNIKASGIAGGRGHRVRRPARQEE